MAMGETQLLPQLQAEIDTLDPSSHAARLLEMEMQRLSNGNSANSVATNNNNNIQFVMSPQQQTLDQPAVQNPDDSTEDGETSKFVDITTDRPVKIVERILIPIKQYPKFNFVGKLLGPKGNSLKRLQEETLTRMAILGKGSMRDKGKEEELRKEGGKYGHLNDDLHIQVEVYAPPAEAHSRLAHAFTELKRYLTPNYNDEIRQAQLEELAYLNTDGKTITTTPPPPPGPGPIRGTAIARGRPLTTQGGLLATPAARATRGVPTVRGRGVPPRRAPPRYEDGYYDEFREQAYEEYETGYTAQGEPEYYEYRQEEYDDSYGETWGRVPVKAVHIKAPTRAKTDYRGHPYGRPVPY